MRKIIIVFGFILILTGCSARSRSIIVVNQNEIDLGIAEVGEIRVLALPMAHRDTMLVWNSLNETVASVNNGLITGVAIGETVVQAMIPDTRIFVDIRVRVDVRLPEIRFINMPRQIVVRERLSESESGIVTDFPHDLSAVTLQSNFNLLQNPQMRIEVEGNLTGLMIIIRGNVDQYVNLVTNDGWGVITNFELMTFSARLFFLGYIKGIYQINFRIVEADTYPNQVLSKHSIILEVI
ncbi:MAG: lipoprotein [Erysipelotrichales bacterium]|nr:lipoprotein [Erysipelotrichales bacterium]